MFAKPGYHIGDTWYCVDQMTAHMFYLTCPVETLRHTRWEIGHAISTDLVTWQDSGVILSPGTKDEWDGICPATGSVMEYQGTYWMAYTGNYAGPVPAVGLATSTDLYHWEKVGHNPVLIADGTLYSNDPNQAWGKPRWRDPFLFKG